MIHCKELNKNFESKDILFKALRESHKDIIAAKKAQIFKSCEKGLGLIARPLDSSKLDDSVKALGQFKDDSFYYIAVNSTKILDSHGDLHIDSIWNRTVKNQQGKNYLVADHKLELDKTIVKKEYVEIFTAIVPFSAIGKSYDGNTEILVYKVRKDKVINTNAKEWLESGDAIEASVRMQYVKILFALDSDAREDIEFKKNYDKYITEVANKEDFENDIDYFWPVLEAKNIYESSLVLFGSNPATGHIVIDDSEKSTQDSDSEKSTQDKKDFYLKLLKQ